MQKILGRLVMVSFLVGFSAFAHDEEGLGKLVGKDLALFYSDHAISGHVKERLVFSSPLEKEFGVKLVHRAGGRTFESTFKQDGKNYVGTVETDGGKKAAIVFTRISGKDGVIEGTLDGAPLKVTLSAKKLDGSHYENPRFDVTLPNKTYSFQLEDGHACIACATRISFAVLGMLRVTGAL